MLYRIGTASEVSVLDGKVPDKVLNNILRDVVILDTEYGESRNYLVDGGYVLIADTSEDVRRSIQVVGETCPCEWVIKLGDSGWVSVLYLLNDDFAVVLYALESVIPSELLQEMEEDKQ